MADSPLADEAAARGRRAVARLSLDGVGGGRTLRWFRQGWFGGPETAEWPADTVETVYLRGERHESSGDGGSSVSYTPEPKLLLTGDRVAPVLEKSDGGPALAVAAVALARSLECPLWISRHLGAEDQSALRRALESMGYMEVASVVEDLPDRSWDERLASRPSGESA